MLYFVIIVIGSLLSAYFVRKLAISRTFQLFGKLVSRVKTDEKLIALTFDDGPRPEYTQEILRILSEEQAKATFFLLGRDIKEYPDETKLIISSGHEIGNHTYNHPRMFLVSNETVTREIEETENLIKEAGYTKKTLFRPPYGTKFFSLPYYLMKNDIVNVTWDIEPETNSESAGCSEKIADYVVRRAKPGSIVLLHVMFEARKLSMQAVPKIIRQLKKEGFEFVTVSELIASEL